MKKMWWWHTGWWGGGGRCVLVGVSDDNTNILSFGSSGVSKEIYCGPRSS